LEEIVQQGNLLFTQGGRELPLNSSFASNNIQNGDILESCSSPLMSSLLSSVLQDLNSIEKLGEDQRDQEHLQPLLEGINLDPWPDVGRWSNDKLKTRKICLPMMKKILQRDDRFANNQVPPLTSLNGLHQFMQLQFTSHRRGRGGFNSMSHIFKPNAKNRNGQPTVAWEMMQHKFNIAKTFSNEQDSIDSFVTQQHSRHHQRATPSSSSSKTKRRLSSTRESQLLNDVV
jgi:hypothetical protein